MSELTNELRGEANGSRAMGDHGNAEMLDRTADRIDKLEECLRECADDLECELDARYPKSVRAYACMESDYQRDMSPVYKARALLDE